MKRRWKVTLRKAAWGHVMVMADTEEEARTIALRMLNEQGEDPAGGWDLDDDAEVARSDLAIE